MLKTVVMRLLASGFPSSHMALLISSSNEGKPCVKGPWAWGYDSETSSTEYPRLSSSILLGEIWRFIHRTSHLPRIFHVWIVLGSCWQVSSSKLQVRGGETWSTGTKQVARQVHVWSERLDLLLPWFGCVRRWRGGATKSCIPAVLLWDFRHAMGHHTCNLGMTQLSELP